jgi:hypothetical protein
VSIISTTPEVEIGGSRFKVNLEQKVSETPISTNKPQVIACHANYIRGIDKRILVQAGPRPKHKTLLKK